MVLSSLKTLLLTYWPHLLLLLVAGIVIAWKLRLMKKFGFYLVGVGVFFFSSGIVTAGNPILLLIGNAFFLAGTSYTCLSLVEADHVIGPGWINVNYSPHT